MIQDSLDIDRAFIKYANSIYDQFVTKRYGIKVCSGLSQSEEELFAAKECAQYQKTLERDSQA